MKNFKLKDTEIILNNDGSIYHLGIKSEHIAPTIITVGDPERVKLVSSFFDEIHFSHQNREFFTTTGTYKKKKISVISTGIGTDNIDIVLNELNFLANWDIHTRKILPTHNVLTIIRLGTSGSVSPQIAIDDIVLSSGAIAADALFEYYSHPFEMIDFLGNKKPYIPCDAQLLSSFSTYFNTSLTLTAPGFYAPQFRNSSVAPKYNLEHLQSITVNETLIGNIEMETSGIYGLAALLGHRAISVNAILAHRLSGNFSAQPQKTIHKMISISLDIIASL